MLLCCRHMRTELTVTLSGEMVSEMTNSLARQSTPPWWGRRDPTERGPQRGEGIIVRVNSYRATPPLHPPHVATALSPCTSTPRDERTPGRVVSKIRRFRGATTQTNGLLILGDCL